MHGLVGGGNHLGNWLDAWCLHHTIYKATSGEAEDFHG